MSETDIKKLLLERLNATPGVMAIRMNSGSPKVRFRGAPKGTPDILVLLSGGFVLWLELKREKRKSNESNPATVDAQAKMHARMAALDHIVIVARDVQSAMDIVLHYRYKHMSAKGA